jgi:hypothetical protein
MTACGDVSIVNFSTVVGVVKCTHPMDITVITLHWKLWCVESVDSKQETALTRASIPSFSSSLVADEIHRASAARCHAGVPGIQAALYAGVQ